MIFPQKGFTAIPSENILLNLLRINLPAITNYIFYSDQELMLLVQQGNEQAFAVLYHRYFSVLCYKAFKRIPDELVVKEIVQDVFMNLWAKAAHLDAAGNIGAYLFATLRNKILHELRNEHTRMIYAEKINGLYKSWLQNNSADPLEAKQLEENITGIISTLSAQCREAFLLSRYENLSYKEIAQRMNISVNTVEKHIAKALRILRAKFKGNDIIT